ncbi:MAG: AAA family ATPase [Gammaproteobacteria bacterium]|nr:AAA family ATPase [Gammaproteobacteria bacterium]
MPRIEQLIVENYRGAATRLQLDFDGGKPVALVFGENGTGKTTIVDALDAVGNCSKGSLEDKSSTRARDHLPTIGKKPADILITLISGANTWNATLAGDNLSTNPEPRPKIHVLRRSHLQKLIEAQPAQRYEALRHFIDVGKVERAENALRDAASGAKTEFNAAVKRRFDAETQLQTVWEAEGKPGTNALEWAKTIAEHDTVKLDQEIERLRLVQSTITRAETCLMEWQQARATADQRLAETKEIDEEVAKLPGVDAQQAISLAGVLRQVSQHLQLGTYPDECPVCRQGIPLDELKADIQTRLVDLQQYDQLRSKRDTANRNTQLAKQAIENKQGALLTAARALVDIVQAGDIAIITAAKINQADYVEFAKQDGGDAAITIKQAEQLVGELSGLKQALADSETATSKKSGMINSIRVQFEQVQESTSVSEELAQLQAALQDAYDTARLTRIEFTQKILDDIATECNRLYALIHPNEPIAISRLALDQGKRASLSQAATFEGHDNVPPQAYFSESHLDTLGFCFWLALVKRESPNADVVVVLDDVFTSVDAQHINRISQLITDESKNFAQVIATTHQRLWRDIYRYQHGAGKLTQMIELQRWSLSKGISNYKTRLAVDDLIASIAAAPFDRQVTASRAGILLEAVLDWLALQYRCRVARTHDGSYTLGELLDGTESLFKKLEIHRPDLDTLGQSKNPAQYVASKVDGITGQIRSLNFLRNQVGAHFNTAGAAISDADIQLFADMTVKFAEALSCETCGQIPGKKTAAYFQCSCTAPFEVRMQPIQL